jgi:hypothetical protein
VDRKSRGSTSASSIDERMASELYGTPEGKFRRLIGTLSDQVFSGPLFFFARK